MITFVSSSLLRMTETEYVIRYRQTLLLQVSVHIVLMLDGMGKHKLVSEHAILELCQSVDIQCQLPWRHVFKKITFFMFSAYQLNYFMTYSLCVL